MKVNISKKVRKACKKYGWRLVRIDPSGQRHLGLYRVDFLASGMDSFGDSWQDEETIAVGSTMKILWINMKIKMKDLGYA